MVELWTEIEVERREPIFNHCNYCIGDTIAMHQVRTIDDEVEWVCGRHKRYTEKGGLAGKVVSRGTEHKSLADYYRERLHAIEAERGASVDKEMQVTIKGVGPENWIISDLRRTYESRQQMILVTAFNTALNDVAEARQEGPEGFERKVSDMTLSMQGCIEIAGLDERQDRLCAILAYNHGLKVGSQVYN